MANWRVFALTAGVVIVGCWGSTERDPVAGEGGASAASGGIGAEGGGGIAGGVGNTGGFGATGSFGGNGGFASTGGTGNTGGFTSSGGFGSSKGFGATGGTLQTGGAGAVGGVGGAGATGGTLCYAGPAPLPAACGKALCGNGSIDTCGAGPSEECDGAQLGATCTSVGYSGGSLACLSNCWHDTANCSRCVAPTGHVAACSTLLPGARPSALALAATVQQIGVAWISNELGPKHAWFARFNADLTLIAKTGPLPAPCPDSVFVAARPGGWSVVSSGNGQVDVHAIDANGQQIKSTVLSSQGEVLAFAERSDGGSLLVWLDGDLPRISVVSADGLSITPPVKTAYFGMSPTAAFVGDGFLIAGHVDGNGVAVTRVEVDGSTKGTLTHPVPGPTGSPALTGDGSGARMVYRNFGVSPSRLELARLDKLGNAIGTPAVLGTMPGYYEVGLPVAAGNDTIVLLARYSGQAAAHLDVARVGPTGVEIWGPQAVAADPQKLMGYRLAARGPELVAAFRGSYEWPTMIGAARITP